MHAFRNVRLELLDNLGLLGGRSDVQKLHHRDKYAT
jgi:hypothetical protein